MKVVVTGASRGIGKAIALAFAREAHELILCSSNSEKLDACKAEILKEFPATQVALFRADLSDRNQLQALANFCLQGETPYILVNNAGVFLPGNISDEAEGVLEKLMAINLFAAYHLTRALLPAMMTAQKGHIFNICSVASLKAYKGGGAYSISKFALNGFSQNLRSELMPYGIKVTAVFPGAVLTDSWGDFDNGTQRIMEVGDIAKMIVAATQLSPQAVVEEITIRPQLGDLP